MSWTDSLKPQADVGIKISGQELLVVFSLPPTHEVLEDFFQLEDKPGFNINDDRRKDLTFIVSKPDTYRNVDVLNCIQQMLESHSLTVETLRF